jgi:hypothetical protein
MRDHTALRGPAAGIGRNIIDGLSALAAAA